MNRDEWRVFWRWVRTEKKRLAWVHEPPQPTAPVVIDWGLVGREWGRVYDFGPPLVLGRCSIDGDTDG